ncbi:MAG TPA: hypothetical protein VHP37_07360 [Burkholderiales bacterium]|nr:hypothetical protein [Burkholderiales bacterium]
MANAADLPIQQPTSFDLVVNVVAAKAVGVNLPGSFSLGHRGYNGLVDYVRANVGPPQRRSSSEAVWICRASGAREYSRFHR